MKIQQNQRCNRGILWWPCICVCVCVCARVTIYTMSTTGIHMPFINLVEWKFNKTNGVIVDYYDGHVLQKFNQIRN